LPTEPKFVDSSFTIWQSAVYSDFTHLAGLPGPSTKNLFCLVPDSMVNLTPERHPQGGDQLSVGEKGRMNMENLRNILQQIPDRGLTLDSRDHSLDRYTYAARHWLQAFEAESQNRLDWPAKLVGEKQIEVQDIGTGDWIVIFV
jgi:hypothetical protein